MVLTLRSHALLGFVSLCVKHKRCQNWRMHHERHSANDILTVPMIFCFCGQDAQEQKPGLLAAHGMHHVKAHVDVCLVMPSSVHGQVRLLDSGRGIQQP